MPRCSGGRARLSDGELVGSNLNRDLTPRSHLAFFQDAKDQG
jgi:hypothetical protein